SGALTDDAPAAAAPCGDCTAGALADRSTDGPGAAAAGLSSTAFLTAALRLMGLALPAAAFLFFGAALTAGAGFERPPFAGTDFLAAAGRARPAASRAALDSSSARRASKRPSTSTNTSALRPVRSLS